MAKTAAKKTGATSKAKTATQAPAETSPQAPVKASAKAATQPTPKAGSKTVSHEDIARLAYSLWEQDGRRHGHDKTYWTNAEQQLRRSH